MAEYKNMNTSSDESSPKNWSESDVREWLKGLRIKDNYVNKIHEEEVNGQILFSLDADYLQSKIGMKSGPAHFVIQKRDELFVSYQKSQGKKKSSTSKRENEIKKTHQCLLLEESVENNLKDQPPTLVLSAEKDDCKPRPFDQEATDFYYAKHKVLVPESGAYDLINPCREFKSFALAATKDRTRLQAKFAKEVLKFATGCMNIRSNGTIHFGVMDSKEDAGYVHGEIIGIPVKEKDIYVDALDYIERSFPSDKEQVRQCVRPPRFIEVIDCNNTEVRFVVEVDIVPLISIVKSKVYAVRLPNFKEATNKVEMEKETIYRRVGSKTEPLNDKELNDFYQRIKDRDGLREQAEKVRYHYPHISENLGRKLKMLITSGKKYIEKDKWFILVSNKFKSSDLNHTEWLLNMNLFCVFDFDPDTNISGFCSRYLQRRGANKHFLHSYRMPGGTSTEAFVKELHLFDQTSWIFCNGRTDYEGNESPCDEITWIKTKMTFLREAVSLICKQILPKGSFQVIFLLTLPVEKPILHTFFEFFTDMEGHEDIICICESETDFKKWQKFAEGSCEPETVKNFSVVGMKMSHINATLQQVQPLKVCAKKLLPTFVKGNCLLETHEEEQMYSLEVVTADHCVDTTDDFINDEKANIESQFYRGGRLTWLNLWLAEQKYVGDVIERDAYYEVSKLLNDALKGNTDQASVGCLNIYHHPGSGGSTVARQVLWNNRKQLRCAVVKISYSIDVVAQHAIKLREYEEKDQTKCLPVLLLIEDFEKDYIDDLRNELEFALNVKKIPYGMLCFIILSCRRSNDPETKCKESALQNVSITHKLSPQEKRKFAQKRKVLECHYEPQFVLTFVLMMMSEDFNKEYVQKFVKHLLQGISHKSAVTRLILYVALLNTYVPNSFISQSHCEALLSLTCHLERFRQHEFERSLSDQAKLVFVHLRDDKTHIKSIKIIHPLVAKEVLHQLLGEQKTQSSLAMDLLHEEVLFIHRFGREEYVAFLRALFIRRSRVSNGDESNSFFSPLIEHVCDCETPETAIALLEEAFEIFHKDAIFAQQLARLLYRNEMFEKAEIWADTAAKKLPHNSYVLDTKGHVYRMWFRYKCKQIKNQNIPKTPQNTVDAVHTALKALDCFHECQKVAEADMEDVNSSGFFSEVEVGCSLLELISSLEIFKKKPRNAECIKYLSTSNYIPEELETPWEPFHGRLKQLCKTMQEALEWISEDLSYFQTEVEDEGNYLSPEDKINHPLTWLSRKSSEFGKYFCDGSGSAQHDQQAPSSLTAFQKSMVIQRLGGGNVTSILSKLTLSKLTEQKDAVRVLETILSYYPSNPLKAKLVQREMVNYIFTHITLNCLLPDSPMLASLKALQELSCQFPSDKRKCQPYALFLLTLLFWPEDDDKEYEKEYKFEIVQSAVEHLKKSYQAKMKDIPRRKRRIYTHFFLGKKSGLNKFVPKKSLESVTKWSSVSEKRMKWYSGEAWKMPEIDQMLERVSGWTEDGEVYIKGPQQKKLHIFPLYVPSLPHSNENITFYLGFTFRGIVAFDITVRK